MSENFNNNDADNYFNEGEIGVAEKKPAAPKGLTLEVPFAEKDQAKALGARWNPEIKKWFVPDGVEKEKFSKWIK